MVRIAHLNRFAAPVVAAALLAVVGCKPKAPDPQSAQGPRPDLVVEPGLSIFMESDRPLRFSIAAVKPSGEATALFEGKLVAGGTPPSPINKPDGSDIRLLFEVAPLPKRGEAPSFLKSAADGPVAELAKSGTVAEIVYKGGTQSFAVTSEANKAIGRPR